MTESLNYDSLLREELNRVVSNCSFKEHVVQRLSTDVFLTFINALKLLNNGTHANEQANDELRKEDLSVPVGAFQNKQKEI